MPDKKKYDIAAYIWPSYTGDELRSRIFWPDGIGEWQTVKNAQAKFPGHQWPRKPLWGYVNEADPYVMEMQISAAASHGVNTFIYDWYWYDGKPFLENCLNDGFLKAKNNHLMKFYIMWANHSVDYLWDKRNSHLSGLQIWDGACDLTQFKIIGKRLIERYFSHPCYYKIDGKPVFMIYDIANLLRGLGGADKARTALDWLREECVRAGLPGLHLQVTIWNEHHRFCADAITGTNDVYDKTPAEIFRRLGIESMSHYQYVHFANIDRDYQEIIPDVIGEWNKLDGWEIPYFAHVSLGWDTNPRFKELKSGIVKNATPEKIEIALREAKKFTDAHPERTPLITINSWNEWTETSYLEPDDLYGYGYLEAVKRVFVDEL